LKHLHPEALHISRKALQGQERLRTENFVETSREQLVSVIFFELAKNCSADALLPPKKCFKVTIVLRSNLLTILA